MVLILINFLINHGLSNTNKSNYSEFQEHELIVLLLDQVYASLGVLTPIKKDLAHKGLGSNKLNQVAIPLVALSLNPL